MPKRAPWMWPYCSIYVQAQRHLLAHFTFYLFTCKKTLVECKNNICMSKFSSGLIWNREKRVCALNHTNQTPQKVPPLTSPLKSLPLTWPRLSLHLVKAQHIHTWAIEQEHRCFIQFQVCKTMSAKNIPLVIYLTIYTFFFVISTVLCHCITSLKTEWYKSIYCI